MQSYVGKILGVGFLGVLLLIPLAMISILTQDRERQHNHAVLEVGAMWGHSQVLQGPFLVIPFRQIWVDKDNRTVRSELRHAIFLPEQLSVTTEMRPQVRRRGIYEVLLYEASVSLSGYFSRPKFEDLGIGEHQSYWDNAAIVLGISDPRGIQEYSNLELMGLELEPQAGPGNSKVIPAGIHAPIPGLQEVTERFAFRFQMTLRGSEEFTCVPAGRATTLETRSDWPEPSFLGNPLPSERVVSGGGFNARWVISHLTRNFPQRLTTQDKAWTSFQTDLGDSAFGVRLLPSVASYQKVTRSTKYGVLFIGLTLLVVFLFELLNSLKIHVVHYLLVGAAITIFYLLLLSLCEHIGFGWSFLLASLAVTGLVTIYSFSFLRLRLRSLGLGSFLGVLYTALYLLLQVQDYALLIGSIAVFVMLAAVMYLTRNVDWYQGDRLSHGGKTQSAGE